MTYCASRGVGQYVAGEAHEWVFARHTKPGARGVVYAQGSHGLANVLRFGTWDQPAGRAIADRGYQAIAGDLSQTLTQGTFGNDTARSRVGSLKTFLQGTIGAASGKVWGFAGSGGCTALLNYARQNPTHFAALVLLNPLIDPQDFYDNNRGGTTIPKTELEAAYGGSAAAFAAAMPAHNPARNTGELTGVPMRLYYSTNDPYIPVATVTAFAAAVNTAGGTADTFSLGAVGHTAGALTGDQIADYFDAHP